MRYRRVLMLVSLSFVLFIAGCDLLGLVVPPPVSAQLDEEFVLHMGQSATLADQGLSITFIAVPADGRCPLNIDCAATYPVQIGVRIQEVATGASSELELSAHTDYDGYLQPNAPGITPTAPYGDYLVHLLRVTPYPDYERERRLSEYAITLRVTASPTDSGPVTNP